jgi:hypothetical protein
MEATYASKGVAGTGLGFGIAGTALALLQGGGLGGLLGGWGCNGGTAVAGGMGLAALAEKDATIAELRAELDTDRKLVQVWDNLNTKREATDKEVSILKTKCDYLQYILMNITKVVVPNDAVCPGWGAISIAPSTGTGTGTGTASGASAASAKV